jgi:hypothetical protein
LAGLRIICFRNGAVWHPRLSRRYFLGSKVCGFSPVSIYIPAGSLATFSQSALRSLGCRFWRANSLASLGLIHVVSALILSSFSALPSASAAALTAGALYRTQTPRPQPEAVHGYHESCPSVSTVHPAPGTLPGRGSTKRLSNVSSNPYSSSDCDGDCRGAHVTIITFCPLNGLRASTKVFSPSMSSFQRGPWTRTRSSTWDSCCDAMSRRAETSSALLPTFSALPLAFSASCAAASDSSLASDADLTAASASSWAVLADTAASPASSVTCCQSGSLRLLGWM